MALIKYREPNQAKWRGVRPAHNGTRVHFWGYCNNNSVTLYTVTTGKTLYLVSELIKVVWTTSAARLTYIVTDAADAMVWTFINDQVGGNSFALTARDREYPFEIPSGYKIKLTSSGVGASIEVEGEGWEE